MSLHPEAIDIIYSTIMAELAQRCEIDEELMNDPGVSLSPSDEKQSQARQKLVNILCREGELPRIPEAVGNLLQNLAKRGVFQRGGILLEGPLLMAYAGYFCVTLPRAAATIRKEAVITIGFPRGTSRQALDDSAISFEEAVEMREGLVREDAKVYQLTTDYSQRYLARSVRVFPRDVINFLLEDPVKAVLLYQGGSLIRLPSPERCIVASLISQSGGIGDSEIDWLINAITLRRLQAEVVLALNDAIAQHSAWENVIQRSLANLSGDLCARILKVCRDGSAALGDPQSLLTIFGVDKS